MKALGSSTGIAGIRVTPKRQGGPERPTVDSERNMRVRCPVTVESVTFGQDSIGTPTIGVGLRNKASKAVAAVKFSVLCFNKFDEPVSGHPGDHSRVSLIYQHTIPPGDYRYSSWLLDGYDTVAKERIAITRVKMEDGEEWLPTPGCEEESSWIAR